MQANAFRSQKNTDYKLLVLTGPLLNAHVKVTFASPMQASNELYMSKNDAARKRVNKYSDNLSILDIGLHRYSSPQ